MDRFPIDVTMVPVGPVNGTIRPPGSKSITNRAFLVAALASGTSQLNGWLDADDTQAMRDALTGLGVTMTPNGATMVVEGRSGRLAAPQESVDVRSSGTTARFITAAAALADGPVRVDGSAQLRRRPIEPLVASLQSAGVEVDYLVATGALPICVHPASLGGGRVLVDASVSSQFASGLMLVSPYAHADTEIDFVDGVAVSRSYLETTAEVMRAFGARVVVGDSVSVSAGSPYKARSYDIEADASAAIYPLVAGAITGGEVTVEGIPAASTQSDLGVLEVLEAMGCRVVRSKTHIMLCAPIDGELHGVDADLSQAPDGALALAVACAFATGPSTLRGLSTLRYKETDRLTALATELSKIGAEVVVGDDSLRVVPGAHRGARIETYDDHRMAMAFSLAGLVIPGVVIDNPGCVAKTWPGYWTSLEELGAGSVVAGPTATIVAIDGPGGVGKTTVSRTLADRLGLGHLDTGAFYRGATAAVLRSGVSISDPVAVVDTVHKAQLSYTNGQLLLDGIDISEEIRSTAVTSAVSAVAAIPEVRDRMVQLQRRWVAHQPRGAVVEGRDIGTVVFPDADLKIFLTARPEIRARRRAGEVEDADVGSIQQDLERRDRADSSREVSPLRAADDAVIIDTSDLPIETVVDNALEHVADHS